MLVAAVHAVQSAAAEPSTPSISAIGDSFKFEWPSSPAKDQRVKLDVLGNDAGSGLQIVGLKLTPAMQGTPSISGNKRFIFYMWVVRQSNHMRCMLHALDHLLRSRAQCSVMLVPDLYVWLHGSVLEQGRCWCAVARLYGQHCTVGSQLLLKNASRKHCGTAGRCSKSWPSCSH
jgi:hypothetical protein